MTWTSSLIVSGRFQRGCTIGSENKEARKVGIKLCEMPSKLIVKSSTFYTMCGETMRESSETYPTMGQSQEEADQAMLPKGNRGSFHMHHVLAAFTDHHSFLRRGFPRIRNLSSPRALAPGHFWSC